MAAVATIRDNPHARDALWYGQNLPGRNLTVDQDELDIRFPNHRQDLDGTESFAKACAYFLPAHVVLYYAIRCWIRTNKTREEFAIQSTTALRTALVQPGFGSYTQWGGASLGMVFFVVAMACYFVFAIKFELSSVVSGRVVLALGCVCWWCFAASTRTQIHVNMIADVHHLIVVHMLYSTRRDRVRQGIDDMRGLTQYNLVAFNESWSAAIANHPNFMTTYNLNAEQMQDLKFKFCGQLAGADAITTGDELFRQMAGQPADVKASMMKYAVAMKYVNSPAARRFADRYAKMAFKFCLY